VYKGGERGLQKRVTIELNDEYTPTVRMYIRRGAAKAAQKGGALAHVRALTCGWLRKGG
jgi:hypothetical protein